MDGGRERERERESKISIESIDTILPVTCGKEGKENEDTADDGNQDHDEVSCGQGLFTIP